MQYAVMLLSLYVYIVQVDNLRHKSETQETEVKKSRKLAREAMILAAEESAKLKAAKDAIKSLTSQVISLSMITRFMHSWFL